LKLWRVIYCLSSDPAARREAGWIVRYGLVGAATSVVFYSADIGAVELAGIPPATASLSAQVVTIGVAYYGHALISFQVKPKRDDFIRFVIITAITMAANWSATELITGYLAQSYLASMIIVSGLVPALSYLCNRFWVFMPGLVTHSAKARRAD
jgi:putative flippase GtrA